MREMSVVLERRSDDHGSHTIQGCEHPVCMKGGREEGGGGAKFQGIEMNFELPR